MEYSLSTASGEAASTLSYNSGDGNPARVVGGAAEEEQQQPPPPAKKKRNQPGMPDPEAEVVALSPKSLMATNRFVCEICGKGFQRDQNLQLHRRGHNLPWKLRQRGPKEAVRKRVYVCPEPTCVHHDPRRALGDLTGIKKHFCRKHGEKKWKCERCAKKYAVQSDWKAHLKTCGTREYKCDCGTVFSRRDSFVTHRAFCDALAQESAKVQSLSAETGSPPATSSAILSPVLSTSQSSEMQESTIGVTASSTTTSNCNSANENGNIVLDSSMFAPLSSGVSQSISQPQSSFPSLVTAALPNLDHSAIYSTEPPQALSLSPLYQLPANSTSPLFQSQDHQNHQQFTAPMSATALLQKAAQMGAAGPSGSSLLCGFAHTEEGKGVIKLENGSSVPDRLSLGLPLNSPGFFGSKPTTLDFLGLGIGPGSSSALPGYLTSIGGPLDIFGDGSNNMPLQGSWGDDEAADRKTKETLL